MICKSATSGNEPREHVLPETLGNTEHVLRRGLVCGKCNNYFASKVEKPFLELGIITALRFEQALPSKKGRIPRLAGILWDSMLPVEMMRDVDTGEISICLSEEAVRAVMVTKKVRLSMLKSGLVTPGAIVSRFVGKVALEALAYRVQHDDRLLDEMTDNHLLDPLRRHTRYGEGAGWPVSVRRIYDPDETLIDSSGTAYQIVHEFDFLHLRNGETYFVLALFGQELALNLGGPSLNAWTAWLNANNNISPLTS